MGDELVVQAAPGRNSTRSDIPRPEAAVWLQGGGSVGDRGPRRPGAIRGKPLPAARQRPPNQGHAAASSQEARHSGLGGVVEQLCIPHHPSPPWQRIPLLQGGRCARKPGEHGPHPRRRLVGAHLSRRGAYGRRSHAPLQGRHGSRSGRVWHTGRAHQAGHSEDRLALRLTNVQQGRRRGSLWLSDHVPARHHLRGGDCHYRAGGAGALVDGDYGHHSLDPPGFGGAVTAPVVSLTCALVARARKLEVWRFALAGALFGVFIFPWPYVLGRIYGCSLHIAGLGVIYFFAYVLWLGAAATVVVQIVWIWEYTLGTSTGYVVPGRECRVSRLHVCSLCVWYRGLRLRALQVAQRTAWQVQLGQTHPHGESARQRIREAVRLRLPVACRLTWSGSGNCLLHDVYRSGHRGVLAMTLPPPHPSTGRLLSSLDLESHRRETHECRG